MAVLIKSNKSFHKSFLIFLEFISNLISFIRLNIRLLLVIIKISKTNTRNTNIDKESTILAIINLG